MLQIYNVCWLMLAQVQAGGQAASSEAAAAKEAAEGAQEKAPGLFDSWMFPALMAVMLLYFLMMTRPKQGAAVKPSEMLEKLKKNDRVVTAGGILGTVVNVRTDDEYVTIRVDDTSNARIQVLASSIVRIVSDEDKDKDKK